MDEEDDPYARVDARWRPILAAGILGLLLAGVIVSAHVVYAADAVGIGVPFVKGFEDATGIDLILAAGDGQAYAAIARDPLLRDPSPFPTSGEPAYRATRPLFPYLAWLGSLGDPKRVPGAMVALTVLGAGLASAGCAKLLADRNLRPIYGAAVIILPGSLASLGWLLPEMLALGFAAFGLSAWERGRRRRAAGLFAIAGLAREVMLLVPLVLLVMAARQRRREAVWLLPPFFAWLAWGAVVRWRYGFWWHEWHAGAKFEAPFAGFVRGVSRWSEIDVSLAINVLALAILVAVALTLILIRLRDNVRWVGLAYLSIPPFFWGEMWLRWQDFSRVLLPLTVFGALAIGTWARSRYAGPRSAKDGEASPALSPPVA